MRHLTYLAVLAFCLFGALWLEPVLHVNVLRRWRRLLLTVVVVAAVFLLWDVAAITAGHWSFDRAQITGVLLPGRLPVEELLFFVVVPVCAVLGFEAVRAVIGHPAGDEPGPTGDRPAPTGDEPGAAGAAGSPEPPRRRR